ncbi:MAG: aminotransferase class V-fold PLP-dependent enzyme, partial [Erysipelotrichia bacterium]|nr:aminotransferase class V-fold PLP-dependent enzyme [Erysipelotrichia bacterium]
MRRVYFDNASTTKINSEVLTGYEKLLESFYVNSESLYDEGAEVHRMLEKARSSIAGLLDVNPNEVIFTGGSSESNSSVIKGVSWANQSRKHIITTAIEHSSIIN